MYAVTGSPKEYQEEIDTDGKVILFLIEECYSNFETWRGRSPGWDLYWFNDGSDTGCILITDADGVLQPVYDGITREDVFTDAQLRTLEEDEHVIVDAPWGVRKRVLDTEDDEPDYYFDLDQLLNAGRIDYWAQWKQRLVA